MKRSEREIKTVRKMIGIYCRGHHGGGAALCEECGALASYAELRTRKCPFGEGKPACGQCPIHCYKPQMKQAIGRVMRYAGPRMIYRHPLLALRHLIIAKRPAPAAPPAVRKDAPVLTGGKRGSATGEAVGPTLTGSGGE